MPQKPSRQIGKLFEELEKITSELDRDSVDLDEALEKFERGLEIAAELKGRLRDVEQKVEKIKKKFADESADVEE